MWLWGKRHVTSGRCRNLRVGRDEGSHTSYCLEQGVLLNQGESPGRLAMSVDVFSRDNGGEGAPGVR